MLKSVLLLCIYVLGYGYKIHGYLGKLADNYLQKYEPKLYNRLTTLLGNHTISSISSWADKIKRRKEYSWTKNLHYIDILECNMKRYDKRVIYKYCNNSCIVSALQDFTNSIKYNYRYEYVFNNSTRLTNSELLKFIIHFIQDFSQPMHLLGYDRGGNSLKVNLFMNGKNKTSNLHFIWDSILPEYFVNNYVYTCINKRYKVPRDYYKLLEDVLNENIRISCKIYPDSDYIIFSEYFREEYFIKLFDNYQYLLISTLKYIFEF